MPIFRTNGKNQWVYVLQALEKIKSRERKKKLKNRWGGEGKGNENECECSVIEVIDYYIKRSIPLEHYTIGCKKKGLRESSLRNFLMRDTAGLLSLELCTYWLKFVLLPVDEIKQLRNKCPKTEWLNG